MVTHITLVLRQTMKLTDLENVLKIITSLLGKSKAS